MRLAQAFGIDIGASDTNAVIHGGVAHLKSGGALTVLPRLPGDAQLFVLPRKLRNAVYDLVARNRDLNVGKSAACIVPDADMRAPSSAWREKFESSSGRVDSS